MKVTVYGKPKCVQCEYTCKELDKLVEKGQLPGYEYRDVTTDSEAAKDVRATGVTQLPVIVVSNERRTERWSGFKIDKLRGLRSTGNY